MLRQLVNAASYPSHPTSGYNAAAAGKFCPQHEPPNFGLEVIWLCWISWILAVLLLLVSQRTDRDSKVQRRPRGWRPMLQQTSWRRRVCLTRSEMAQTSTDSPAMLAMILQCLNFLRLIGPPSGDCKAELVVMPHCLAPKS